MISRFEIISTIIASNTECRQSYDIGVVGYDITTRKKIHIFDSEGMSEGIREKCCRINLDHSLSRSFISQILNRKYSLDSEVSFNSPFIK